MRARSSYIIAGAVIILLGWIYQLILNQGSCPALITNPGGFPFTGCARIDWGRILLVISTILGAVIIVYGLLSGRSKPIPRKTLAEGKMPTDRA